MQKEVRKMPSQKISKECQKNEAKRVEKQKRQKLL